MHNLFFFRGRKTKRKKNLGKWLLISTLLSGVALISATAGAILAVSYHDYKPWQKTQLTPEEEKWFEEESRVSLDAKLSSPINIMVLGVKVLTSDLKEEDKEKVKDLGYHALVNSFDGVSDSILLIRFNPDNHKLTILSIPRDTKTHIPGYGIGKINAANEEGGPALAAQTISDLLGGISINGYIRINVQGVEKLIDTLGGVTVYVPKDMKYTDHSQHLYINLKKGKQHLNGDEALQFLRFRYDDYGDIGRVQRQQMLMRAVVDKAINPDTLFKSPEIYKIIQSHIDTNLTVEELVALTRFAANTNKVNVEMLMLPGDFNGNGRTEISYWLPDLEKTAKIMAENFQSGYSNLEVTTPENLKVAIQDSTGDPEVVNAMILQLKRAGYQRVYVVQNWGETLRNTRIIAQGGDDVNAIALRAQLGVGEVLVESTGILGSDITIQIGEDWRSQIQHIQKVSN